MTLTSASLASKVRRALLVISLSTFNSTVASAHLGTPFGDIGIALAEADTVVLARTVVETLDSSAGAVTEVEVVAVLAGRADRRIRLVQSPPHIHRHARGDVFVAPLGRGTGPERAYRLDSSTALFAELKDERPLRAVIRAWRGLPRPTPPGLRLLAAMDWIEAPTPLARRLVLDQLLSDPLLARDVFEAVHDRALVDAMLNPALPRPYRQALARAAGLMGRDAPLRSLCDRFPAREPEPLRGALLEAIMTRRGPCALGRVKACAADQRDPLRARCASWLAR